MNDCKYEQETICTNDELSVTNCVFSKHGTSLCSGYAEEKVNQSGTIKGNSVIYSNARYMVAVDHSCKKVRVRDVFRDSYTEYMEGSEVPIGRAQLLLEAGCEIGGLYGEDEVIRQYRINNDNDLVYEGRYSSTAILSKFDNLIEASGDRCWCKDGFVVTSLPPEHIEPSEPIVDEDEDGGEEGEKGENGEKGEEEEAKDLIKGNPVIYSTSAYKVAVDYACEKVYFFNGLTHSWTGYKVTEKVHPERAQLLLEAGCKIDGLCSDWAVARRYRLNNDNEIVYTSLRVTEGETYHSCFDDLVNASGVTGCNSGYVLASLPPEEEEEDEEASDMRVFNLADNKPGDIVEFGPGVILATPSQNKILYHHDGSVESATRGDNIPEDVARALVEATGVVEVERPNSSSAVSCKDHFDSITNSDYSYYLLNVDIINSPRPSARLEQRI